MALSKLSKEVLKGLNGQEISSLRYEGVVGVDGNKLWQEGKVIKVLKTNKDISDLSEEAFRDEFGFSSNSQAAKKMLEEEFGKGTIWDKERKKKYLKKVI